MCGISGHLGADGDGDLVRRMADCGHGTGQGEATVLGSGGVALALRPIGGGTTDASVARTPTGRHTLVLDGDLLDTAGVRSELTTLGHDLASGSDAEVALGAWVEWGPSGLDRLRGEFAVVVWDAETATLSAARDAFGTRPLLVCRVDDGWLVSSDIRGILASGRYDKRPNDRTVYRYLRFGVHDDGADTFFAGIERVLPGEVVTLRADATSAERTGWSRLRTELEDAARSPRPWSPELATQLREQLSTAVRRRTGSDGRVGTTLSGGVGSAALTALLAGNDGRTGLAPDGIDAWTAAYPDTAADETAHVAAVLAAVGSRVDAHRVEPTSAEFKKDMRGLVRAQEEPIGSSGAYTQFRLLREAAGVDATVLDGTGTDELLAGFGAHHLVHLRELRSHDARAAASELGRSAEVLLRRGRPLVTDRLRRRRRIPVESLLSSTFVAAHASEHFVSEDSGLRARLLDDLLRGSLPARLRAADRNARATGVSVRMPFVDRDLARFVFSLPDEAFVTGGVGKRVLRESVRGLVPDSVLDRRDKVGAVTPQSEWFMVLKNHIYGEFLSESFANRPYVDQTAVLEAFEGWIKGTNTVDSDTIWRLLNLELWLQEFFDDRAAEPEGEPRVKTDYEPNARKQLDLTTDDGTPVRRYPLRTELFTREDPLVDKALSYVTRFFDGLPAAGEEHAAATTGRWYYFISEKIVAITQGRSYFIWDIKVGRSARVLSRYVTRTPAGIGLGSPFTMQLAIEEAGLPRVVFAAAGGFVGKLIGRKGLFYELVGGDIRAIDGPTEYSVYPANVSAKLGPKDPDEVAARISAAIRERVPEPWRSSFGGTVVMDANDIGRNVLGKDAPGSKERYELMFADNPLGQGSEQTPMAVVFERPTDA
ncbi:asparagine synthase-related protein [Intrasporangium flavum]|uniref:asparagine synthase-related protein n=1 Tax=Intrasporangium flavum TaxID=1428657 RepID=UPI00097012E9|nr:asparagine synthase-related protein [Intrasporangium flavum]